MYANYFLHKKWGIIWGTKNKKRLADICKGVFSGADETVFDENSPRPFESIFA